MRKMGYLEEDKIAEVDEAIKISLGVQYRGWSTEIPMSKFQINFT